MPIPLAVPLALSGASALLQGGRGLSQIFGGRKKLRNLQRQPRPKYRTAASINEEAQNLVKGGFTPEQRANFYASLNRGANAAFRKSVAQSPNLSSAIQAGLNYQQAGAVAEFGASDAQLAEQKKEQMRRLITGQSNMQTRDDISYRDRQEEYLGQAIQDGWQNTKGSLDTLARGAATGYILGQGGGGSGGDGGGGNREGGTYEPDYLNNMLNKVNLGNRPPSNTMPGYTPNTPATNDDYFSEMYGGPYGNRGSFPGITTNAPQAMTMPYSARPIDSNWTANLYNGPFGPRRNASWRVVDR